MGANREKKARKVRFEEEEIECNTVEMKENSESEAVRASVPVEDLMVMDASLNEKRVEVLFDDGCNTNVILRIC